MWVIPAPAESSASSGCAPASADSSSGSDSPSPHPWDDEFEPSVWWKGKPTRWKSLRAACKRASLTRVLSGLTSPRSTDDPGVASFIASLRASHAPLSRAPASASAPTTSATSGPTSLESFATFDPSSCSWKTFQASLWPLETSSLTWPKRGSMQSGVCTRRTKRRWLLLTSASASFSSDTDAAYPTPVAASDYGSSQNGSNRDRPSGGTPSLETMARKRMFPTPLSVDGINSTMSSRLGKRESLSQAATLFPTPTASMAERGPSPSDANRRSPRLHTVVATMEWPTAVTTDAASAARHTTTAGAMVLGPQGSLTDAIREHHSKMSQLSLPTEPTSEDGRAFSLESPSSRRPSPVPPKVERDEHGVARHMLNVTFVEHLMGFPLGWTGLEPVATEWYRWWLRTHGSILGRERGFGERDEMARIRDDLRGPRALGAS